MVDATGSVSSELKGAVAHVQFAHPKANSLPLPLLLSLASAIQTAGKSPDVCVVILQSAGEGAFCAGANFDQIDLITDLKEAERFFMGFAHVMLALIQCPVPVIVAVQGKVVGGGLGIVAASDYAIAVTPASVRLSELSIGIGPFVISAPLIRRIGPARFADLTISQAWRDASWCLNAGLYSEVVQDKAALAHAIDERAAHLISSGREALSACKQMLWNDAQQWPEVFVTLAKQSAQLLISRNHSRKNFSKNP